MSDPSVEMALMPGWHLTQVMSIEPIEKAGLETGFHAAPALAVALRPNTQLTASTHT
jgi:hypothetical protein